MALPDILTADLRRAFDIYADSLGMDAMDENEVSGMIVKPPSQRKLSARLDRHDRVALVSGVDLADSIRLSSLSAERAGAWLQAVPAKGPIDLTLAVDEMQVIFAPYAIRPLNWTFSGIITSLAPRGAL
jgi:hypothetical protein